jgi:hypothetical protein
MKPMFAFVLALLYNLGAVAAPVEAPTARQIIDRYMQARGGAEAWARVHAMGWAGRIEGAASRAGAMPFIMFFERPDAMRFEIIQQTQRSVRAYDGARGWKMRPGGERGIEVVDYGPEELAAARDACGLDGPLSNPDSKGVKVTLEGSDVVEGQQAWRLKVVLPSGAMQHHWISAASYLDLRYDRAARDPAGRPGTVLVNLRNYEKVGDLLIPMLTESQAAAGGPVDRMVIEKVALDPVLAAGTFEPPGTRPLDLPRHGGVLVNATGQPAPAAHR